jgi:Na+-translocating membrane potential-generating system (MpsC)
MSLSATVVARVQASEAAYSLSPTSIRITPGETQTACPNQAGPYLPHPEHFDDADGVRRHWGRGGTTARTIMQQHYVVTFLEDIYTAVERILIDADEREQVHQTRLAFQRAMEGRSAPRSKRRREGR